MEKELSSGDVSKILSEANGHLVRPEDERDLAAVIQRNIGDFQDHARSIKRQDTATGEAYERTIDKYVNMDTKPKSRGSSFRLIKSFTAFTFDTNNKGLKILGYALTGVVLASLIYIGAEMLNGVKEISDAHKKVLDNQYQKFEREFKD